MVSPAFAVEPVTPLTSATLVMPRVAQLTVIGIKPVATGAPGLLLASTEAPLSTSGQLAEVVVLVIWTWTEAPAARSVVEPPHVRTGGLALLIEQPVAVVPPVSTDHVPVLVGRLSVIVKPW